MFALIVIICLSVLAAIFFVGAISHSDSDLAGVSCVCLVLASIIYAIANAGPSSFNERCVVNTNSVPLKVTYVQYHPFSKNTIEETMVMPHKSVLLDNVKIVDQTKFDMESM